MDEDDSWAEYARVQALADSHHLSSRTWAAEEALESILDTIERRETISVRHVDNLVTNRARKQRKRGKLLAQHADLTYSMAAKANELLEARSELLWHRHRCSGREWRVLVCVGLGYTYASIANTEQVPEATVKTWVRRARLKLAA